MGDFPKRLTCPHNHHTDTEVPIFDGAEPVLSAVIRRNDDGELEIAEAYRMADEVVRRYNLFEAAVELLREIAISNAAILKARHWQAIDSLLAKINVGNDRR